MFHHTLDFWLLTWAGNWEQLSSFSAYPGSLAQQKYEGTWWPQHKSCFLYCLPAAPPEAMARQVLLQGKPCTPRHSSTPGLLPGPGMWKTLPWHRGGSFPHSLPKRAEILDLSSHSALPTDTVLRLSLFAAAQPGFSSWFNRAPYFDYSRILRVLLKPLWKM